MFLADKPRIVSARMGAAFGTVLGLLAFSFVAWLLRAATPGARGPAWISSLPACDAFCNAVSACCACLGFMAIRRGKRLRHRVFMLTALAWSALFLLGYCVFHHYRGEVRFTGHGALRTAYLCLLISHVTLSLFVLPLLLVTVAFAGLGFFERHRRLARWTLPLWLYVSVSGVVVWFLLRS
ncbi:MAG: DUF420 domain-containing protein, partial [bacterium]